MSALRSYRISVPQPELDDLQGRLARTRWPDELGDAGWQDGMDPAAMRSLVSQWQDGYSWRDQEARLNRHPMVAIDIDGGQLVAITARSHRADAIPLVLLHGWPSSLAEFDDMVDELANPSRESAPAFHVVVPSLPGFGFSGPTRTRGWGGQKMAGAVAALMAALGFERYLAHGGDVGCVVASYLATVDAEHVIEIHMNLLGHLLAGENQDNAGDDEERHALEKFRLWLTSDAAYSRLQGTRPQTIAYSLLDSPAGQLAWIAEKFHGWADPNFPISDDATLTAASIFWFTRTAGSAARFYQEVQQSHGADFPLVTRPTGVCTFPYEAVPPVRRWAEQRYTISYWVDMPVGGHIPALETPELVVRSLRDFAVSL